MVSYPWNAETCSNFWFSFFCPKKGLHLLSHPCGCWRTGVVPADSMCNPTTINAAKRFANHNSITVCVAIISITASCTSHIPPILWVCMGWTSRPNHCGASRNPNCNHYFFHISSVKNHSGRNNFSCQTRACGTAFHWQTAAGLMPSIFASSRCEPANWINCSFVISAF